MQMILRTLTLTPIVILVLFATPALGQPGPATLIAPSADVVGSTIAFTWQSSATATWYHFWLGKADTTLVMEQWYTAEHAGCAGGGTCTITLTPPITAGTFIWHIRTWASSGYGPWSTAHMFTMRDVVQAWSGQLLPSRRFTLVLGDEGVLDNETGLVWQRTPSAVNWEWGNAVRHCVQASTGLRSGWRIPAIAELRTLTDFTRLNPALPVGHPFLDVQGYYWTTSLYTLAANHYYIAEFTDRFIGGGQITGATHKAWCVRGGVGI
jgi:hypothetical protein